jgi:PAS domain S-box-containing protein
LRYIVLRVRELARDAAPPRDADQPEPAPAEPARATVPARAARGVDPWAPGNWSDPECERSEPAATEWSREPVRAAAAPEPVRDGWGFAPPPRNEVRHEARHEAKHAAPLDPWSPEARPVRGEPREERRQGPPAAPPAYPPGPVTAHPARATDAPREVIVLPDDALATWSAAVGKSGDPCLVVDSSGTVAALSPAAADLLGAAPTKLVGKLLDESLHLVDFIDGAQEATGTGRRIPPLIAVLDNTLSRGVIRVRRPDGHRLMLDATAAPIHDGSRKVVGAVSFLSAV